VRVELCKLLPFSDESTEAGYELVTGSFVWDSELYRKEIANLVFHLQHVVNDNTRLHS
jgi:hypothetical protein